jgi:hypothetical protein
MHLQRLLLATFLGGVIGTCAELLLLEHFEDGKQWIPLVVGAAGVLVCVWYWVRPGAVSAGSFKLVLAAFASSGALGLWYHYRGNVEFEKEMYPELAGRALVWQSLMGATPTLAPGAMVLLAVVGYAAIIARADRRDVA